MQVHILKWKATKGIGGIYADRGNAEYAAKMANKSRRCIHHRLGLADAIWVIQTYDVQEKWGTK